LIGRQGALCGNINYAEGRFFASEHAVVVDILDKSEIIWLGELLRNMDLNQYSLASAQPGLSVERIQNLHIPVPTMKEQNEIVKLIQKETSKIDSAVGKIENEIKLMQEYKIALISEVVTGKIKVIP
jgi:type I restriction enzyme S subunit